MNTGKKILQETFNKFFPIKEQESIENDIPKDNNLSKFKLDDSAFTTTKNHRLRYLPLDENGEQDYNLESLDIDVKSINGGNLEISVRNHFDPEFWTDEIVEKVLNDIKTRIDNHEITILGWVAYNPLTEKPNIEDGEGLEYTGSTIKF